MIEEHFRAGHVAHQSDLINVAQLISQYYVLKPDIENPAHAVKFGTSGHRGSARFYNFNEVHILAMTQAIVEIRKKNGITGPCFLGKDTHALSEPAIITVLEVLTANNVDVVVQEDNGYTPTPVISNAIIEHNKRRKTLADGIIITASHNPPEYGGIKYNLSNGGPANIYVTQLLEDLANNLIKNNLQQVKYFTLDQAWASGHIVEMNLIQLYVEQLSEIIDFRSIKKKKIKIAIDPLGGAGITCWKLIAEYYSLDITILNDMIDQTFRFISLDKDGLIRMDCSSEYTVNKLLLYRNKFDLAFSNDPDHDRHCIVTPEGLMIPNHYLSVAINYLFNNRPYWNPELAVGKTLVSSAMIDRVVKSIGRRLLEMPVGFKWFVDGLFNGTVGFCGEESAGASFLRFDGSVWSTDKDGIVLCLLAAEITAVTGKNPQQHYNDLAQQFGTPSYNRIHIAATPAQKTLISHLSAEMINRDILAGDPIVIRLTAAPGNGALIGGFKIVTVNGWFAVRSSGTEDIYKIYCESFLGPLHRQQIEEEAMAIISKLLKY